MYGSLHRSVKNLWESNLALEIVLSLAQRQDIKGEIKIPGLTAKEASTYLKRDLNSVKEYLNRLYLEGAVSKWIYRGMASKNESGWEEVEKNKLTNGRIVYYRLGYSKLTLFFIKSLLLIKNSDKEMDLEPLYSYEDLGNGIYEHKKKTMDINKMCEKLSPLTNRYIAEVSRLPKRTRWDMGKGYVAIVQENKIRTRGLSVLALGFLAYCIRSRNNEKYRDAVSALLDDYADMMLDPIDEAKKRAKEKAQEHGVSPFFP